MDQHGHLIDVLVSERRDAHAAPAFVDSAPTHGPSPADVTTDRAPVYPRVVDDLVPAARHVIEQYDTIEWKLITAGSGQFMAGLRPMRGRRRSAHCTRRDWARVRAEPAPRPLRTCRRPAVDDRVRRVHRGRALSVTDRRPPGRSAILVPIDQCQTAITQKPLIARNRRGRRFR